MMTIALIILIRKMAITPTLAMAMKVKIMTATVTIIETLAVMVGLMNCPKCFCECLSSFICANDLLRRFASYSSDSDYNSGSSSSRPLHHPLPFDRPLILSDGPYLFVYASLSFSCPLIFLQQRCQSVMKTGGSRISKMFLMTFFSNLHLTNISIYSTKFPNDLF